MNVQASIRLTGYVPTLAEVCKEIVPLPEQAIVFGVGRDGLPVLYNICDPQSKNIVVWDRTMGQGLLLIKVAIEYILRYKSEAAFKTEFVIISNHTDEWKKLGEHELGVWNKNECIAVVPFWDNVSSKVLFALSGWCYGRQADTRSPVILFIDGLENVLDMSDDDQHNLRYVMQYGQRKNIYIVGTAQSKNRTKLVGWLDGFQREIVGQKDERWFMIEERGDQLLFCAPIVTTI